MKKDLIISAVIGVFGIVLLFFTTNGFTAFTLEQQRLQDLQAQPPEFPDIEVVDHAGETFNFNDLEGRYIFMTFIYTSCASACPEMSSNMKVVYEKIDDKYFEENLLFLSVSFDTKRDTVEVLNRYAEYFKADAKSWKMLRVPDDEELETLLGTYGVTVIPEDDADFQHNTSFYILSPDGRLTEVLDFKEPDAASDILTKLLEEQEGTS